MTSSATSPAGLSFRGPRPDRVAIVALGVVSGLVLASAVLGTLLVGWSWGDALDAYVVTNAVMGLAFGGCGVLLAWHRPRNPIGWLLTSGGLLQAVASALPPLTAYAQQAGAGIEVRRLLATAFVYSWPWAIGLCIPLALLLFPDGRPASRRWRWMVVAVAATAPLFALEMGAAPQPLDAGGSIPYLTWPSYDQWAPLWTLAELRTLATYVLALVALFLRYRRGSDTSRRQLLWLLLALVVVVAALLPWGLVAGTPIAVLFTIPLIPLAVTVAIVRHQLLDIRLVVSRAVTWLLVSLAVLLGYGLGVAALDRLVSGQLGQSALVTVVLVLLAAPLLPRLQRLVDRALYGERSDPTRVVSRVGAQLSRPAGLDDREVAVSSVAASIRSALRLSFVAIEAGRVLDADGPPGADGAAPVWLPLTYGGEVVGRLTVGLRAGERRLAGPDRRVLELLAVPLAAAMHADLVSAELQASRERLVGAGEEERRRLRRELHDGLGPALTGIAFTADAAANSVADPVRAAELLDSLRRDTRTALADVRRVVDDLRPPALDELGLLGAVRRCAEQLGWRADGGMLRIRLEVPDELPPLPAAVEVAAYRIATEALTNVARHSRARSAVVRLRCDDHLELIVSDDGLPSEPWRPDVGLSSMRERTLELGGTFSAGPTLQGGEVRVRLPLGGGR